MSWSTRAGAIAALRTQMQDDDAEAQRYRDAELGVALDQALLELGKARPVAKVVEATMPAGGAVRLDTLIGAATFGSVVQARDVTVAGEETVVGGWQYVESNAGEHYVVLPSSVAEGRELEITVRGGYGFGFVVAGVGTVDTNIPAEWRELALDGAEAYALTMYGKREVGRTNVPPAVAQQTARAAATMLRDFRQALEKLPHAGEMRAVVTWGLSIADERVSGHRGFD